jgi:hypothetical protein
MRNKFRVFRGAQPIFLPTTRDSTPDAEQEFGNE